MLERRVAMRAYDLDGESRSAQRTSAESMTTVKGPSGAAIRESLNDLEFVGGASHLV